MKDMLVRLYDVHEDTEKERQLEQQGIKVLKVLAPDIENVIEFARQFSNGWACECKAACANHPISCFIAVHEKKIVGFACYDATAPNFFGPTGVSEEQRGKGIGSVLLKKSLCAMAEEGYAYAIIGGVGDARVFYEKEVDAKVIEKSSPGIYSRLVKFS